MLHKLRRKISRATEYASSLVRFENETIFFYNEKRSSLLRNRGHLFGRKVVAIVHVLVLAQVRRDLADFRVELQTGIRRKIHLFSKIFSPKKFWRKIWRLEQKLMRVMQKKGRMGCEPRISLFRSFSHRFTADPQRFPYLKQ
jgi:hypothetical protein